MKITKYGAKEYKGFMADENGHIDVPDSIVNGAFKLGFVAAKLVHSPVIVEEPQPLTLKKPRKLKPVYPIHDADQEGIQE